MSSFYFGINSVIFLYRTVRTRNVLPIFSDTSDAGDARHGSDGTITITGT